MEQLETGYTSDTMENNREEGVNKVDEDVMYVQLQL
jgi:hypothetical protein